MNQETEDEFVPPSEEIKEILTGSKVIAVVGISGDSTKNSYKVGKFLMRKGYKVIPVNPNYATILGLKSYPSLTDIPGVVDIVDIFRKPEAVESIVDEAIKKKVKVVWMQEDVVNIKAAQKAKWAGIKVVMNRCIYKAHKKLFTQRES